MVLFDSIRGTGRQEVRTIESVAAIEKSKEHPDSRHFYCSDAAFLMQGLRRRSCDPGNGDCD